MNSLPYLLFTYDLPIDDGVARVVICNNLVDARCVGIGISERAAIRHMESIWDSFHDQPGYESCEEEEEPGEEGHFGDYSY